MARPRRRTRGKKKFAMEARKVREAGEQTEKRASWRVEGGNLSHGVTPRLFSPFMSLGPFLRIQESQSFPTIRPKSPVPSSLRLKSGIP